MSYDVAIVGGGPAGLAVALEAVLRGFSAAVFERRRGPVDKACGEGLMPAGIRSLERLGVMALMDRDEMAPFETISYIQEDGRAAVGRLPGTGGFGIRRVALARAMTRRAREVGVALHEHCAVRSHRVDGCGVTLETDAGSVRAKLLVAADGLHSPLRRAEGLDRRPTGPLRFGLRRHASIAPWSASVEVHFAPDAEAYVTPAGRHRVGIAFLWEHGRLDSSVSFDTILARFPVLQARLANAPWDSSPRGAGPLRQSCSTRTKDRFVLAGDAGGYLDAITGEGLSLAFDGAAALAEVLPDALALGATQSSLLPYELAMERLFRKHARLASLLVSIARRPRLRRFVVDRLMARPGLFDWILGRALA